MSMNVVKQIPHALGLSSGQSQMLPSLRYGARVTPLSTISARLATPERAIGRDRNTVGRASAAASSEKRTVRARHVVEAVAAAMARRTAAELSVALSPRAPKRETSNTHPSPPGGRSVERR